MHPKKTKPRRLLDQVGGAENSSKLSARNFSAKSTATQAQYARIVTLLRSGAKDTMTLRRNGVMMPAARIKEMNERHGYTIERIDRVDLWDEWGFKHPRVAIYELVAEPGVEVAYAEHSRT